VKLIALAIREPMSSEAQLIQRRFWSHFAPTRPHVHDFHWLETFKLMACIECGQTLRAVKP